VFTTQRAASAYSQRYPAAAGKCLIIENGYDEGAFTGVQPDRCGTPAATLLLLHSGLIYPKDRNPSTFFEAVKGLISAGKLDRSRLLIRFRAPHHDEEVKAFAAQHGLADVVEVAPPVPYRQAIAEMMGADLLLVFQGTYFNTQIPAKIYEYLRAQRPVLAVLDPTGDTAAQLRQFEGVFYGDIANQVDIANTLTTFLIAMSKENMPVAFSNNLQKVKKYSRLEQTKILAKQFNRTIQTGIQGIGANDIPH